MCLAYPRVTYYGMTTKSNLVTIWCRHSHKLPQESCRCIVSCKAWVRVGSCVHVHTHANYHAMLKVAEGYRNVWKLWIYILASVSEPQPPHSASCLKVPKDSGIASISVHVLLPHHWGVIVVQGTTCNWYHAGCGSCKHRMPYWALHRRVKAYTHSEPDYILQWHILMILNDLRVWSILEDLTLIIWRRLVLRQQRIQCAWSSNTCRLAWKVLYNIIFSYVERLDSLT